MPWTQQPVPDGGLAPGVELPRAVLPDGTVETPSPVRPGAASGAGAGPSVAASVLDRTLDWDLLGSATKPAAVADEAAPPSPRTPPPAANANVCLGASLLTAVAPPLPLVDLTLRQSPAVASTPGPAARHEPAPSESPAVGRARALAAPIAPASPTAGTASPPAERTDERPPTGAEATDMAAAAAPALADAGEPRPRSSAAYLAMGQRVAEEIGRLRRDLAEAQAAAAAAQDALARSRPAEAVAEAEARAAAAEARTADAVARAEAAEARVAALEAQLQGREAALAELETELARLRTEAAAERQQLQAAAADAARRAAEAAKHAQARLEREVAQLQAAAAAQRVSDDLVRRQLEEALADVASGTDRIAHLERALADAVRERDEWQQAAIAVRHRRPSATATASAGGGDDGASTRSWSPTAEAARPVDPAALAAVRQHYEEALAVALARAKTEQLQRERVRRTGGRRRLRWLRPGSCGPTGLPGVRAAQHLVAEFEAERERYMRDAAQLHEQDKANGALRDPPCGVGERCAPELSASTFSGQGVLWAPSTGSSAVAAERRHGITNGRPGRGGRAGLCPDRRTRLRCTDVWLLGDLASSPQREREELERRHAAELEAVRAECMATLRAMRQDALSVAARSPHRPAAEIAPAAAATAPHLAWDTTLLPERARPATVEPLSWRSPASPRVPPVAAAAAVANSPVTPPRAAAAPAAGGTTAATSRLQRTPNEQLWSVYVMAWRAPRRGAETRCWV